MEKLCVVLILGLCAFALVESATITKAPRAVEGATSCGGSGRLIDMELSGCFAAPCNLTINTEYDLGITFLAGEASSNVQWQVWVYIPEGGVRLLQDIDADGSIEIGNNYSIVNKVTLDGRYSGIPGEISILLTNKETGSRISCGEFAIQVAAASH